MTDTGVEVVTGDIGAGAATNTGAEVEVETGEGVTLTEGEDRPISTVW